MPSFLAGGFGAVVLAVLVLGAGSLLALAVSLLVARPQSELASFLAPYGQEGDVDRDASPEGVRRQKLVKADVVRRAMTSASRVEIGRRVVSWLERRLDQANVPLRAAEAGYAYAAAAALLSVLAFVMVGPVFAAGVVGGLTALPLVSLSFLARRRRMRFTAQLPDALKLLSGTLRAGFSLVQGMETLAQEVGEPMGHELRRVLSEARLGRNLEDALNEMAARLESPDFEWTVMAIGIQREVGGNLAELLDTVAETMQARDRLRREVRALTAEGRISAVVIGVLPIGLAGFMWLTNRAYIATLTSTTAGQAISVGTAVLAAVGFYWMKKTIEIEI